MFDVGCRNNGARGARNLSIGHSSLVTSHCDVSAAGYTAAVDRFRRLAAVPASEWEALEPGARAGKFFVAAVEDERLLEALRELIDECLDEGCSEAEFVHRASGLLGELTDPESGRTYYDPEARRGMSYEQRIAYDRDVRNLDSAARLKLIFRTQWELGAGYAEWEKAQQRLQRFPGWRFVRQPGAKTKRPDHVAHEGAVRLISDIDFWLARNRPEIGGFNQPHGPWGYNSWMRVEPVSRAECERLGLLAPGQPVEMPPEAAQWDLQHAIDEGNTASMDGLSPEGQERVVERCREQGVTIEQREEPTPLQVGDELERELLELIDLLSDDEEEMWGGRMVDVGCRMVDVGCSNNGAQGARDFSMSCLAEALAQAGHSDVAGANPYGCNGSGHQFPCKKARGFAGSDMWRPANLPQLMPANRALQVLRRGVTVQDPTGFELRLDFSVLAHWVKDGKKLSDIRRRLRGLNRAIMAMRQPNEIWKTGKGERIYLAALQAQKGRRGHGAKSKFVAITLGDDSMEISTYYPEPDRIEAKRQGECIYQKKKRRSRGRSRATAK